MASSNDGMDAVTLRLTAVALAVSIVAIVLSTLQAFLAYLQFNNSEVSKRTCSGEVMGELWAKRTERKFNWGQFRYLVFFEVPVFYTAPPDITVGPLRKMKPKLTFLDRFWFTSKSEPGHETTPTFQEEAQHMGVIEFQKHIQPMYKITGTEMSSKHTMTKFEAHDVWASVHTTGDEDCSWVLLLNALQEQERISRAWDASNHGGRNYTIAYLIQRKRRCWDFVPLSITKPFATTMICHLMEIISMLGLVWVEFDLNKSILSAEGNGYRMRSEYMPGLGIMTRFSRLSKPIHGENRIIPYHQIRRLCFGEVPSIFDVRGIKHSLALQFGPEKLEEIISRLMPRLAGVYQKCILDPNARPLVFPYAFELLGMVAKSVHLPGSRFRKLLNPCAAVWAAQIDFAICLKTFGVLLETNTDLGDDDLTKALRDLFQKGRMYTFILNGSTLDHKIGACIRNRKDHAEANAHSSWIFASTYARDATQKETSNKFNSSYIDMLDSLHYTLQIIDNKLEEENLEKVREVLALHLAAILSQESELENELANATLDNLKEEILLKFYFERIHPKVMKREKSSQNASVSLTRPSIIIPPRNSSDTDRRSAVWLALVFKPLSWLFLHDFNSDDRMTARSDFKDNRLPVYIS